MLKQGEMAPDFELVSDTGRSVRLSELRGRKVVLYFYPKDDTSGCTKEACDFRDRASRIEGSGAAVLGVSPDGVESHKKFKAKYELPFELLVDGDHAVAKAYGAFGEKKRFGKTREGVLRTTFIIDEAGRVARVFENVKVEGHADRVLEALEG